MSARDKMKNGMTGWTEGGRAKGSIIRDVLTLGAVFVVAFTLVWLFRDQVRDGVSLLEVYADTPIALLVAILVFLIGSFFLVPQWLLIGAAIAAFGFVRGGSMAWLATLVVAQIHLGLAVLFRERLGRRLSGSRYDRLRALFGRNSFQSGLMVRLIPTGPAVLVNMAAALAGVRLGPFMLGTAVGIVPKIVLTGLVAQGILSGAQGQRVGLMMALGALGLIGLVLLSRWAKRRRTVNDEK